MSGSETDKVKRYDISFTNQDVHESRTGFWVHYADYASLQSRLSAAQGEIARLRELLGMLYDKWENGDPCYQDGDVDCDSLGNAFKLSDEEENSILAALSPPSQQEQKS